MSRSLSVYVAVAVVVIWLAGAIGTSLPAGRHLAAGAAEPAAGASHASRLHSSASLPVSFEPNVGQFQRDITFVAREPGYTVALTRTGVLLLPGGRPGVRSEGAQPVLLRFLGAGSRVTVEGCSRLPGTASYFLGGDRRRWRTGVPTYGSVRYRNMYPGIDLQFRSSGGALEYDWLVRPGADPARIQLLATGARPALDAQGNIVLRTGSARLAQLRPAVYQQVQRGRVPVEAHYVLGPGGIVSFRLGRYDLRAPLTIDPRLKYSTYIGGSGSQYAYGIALDSLGNSYISGNTDLPLSLAVAGRAYSGGGQDVFVVKLDPSGHTALYAAYIGGSQTERAGGIAVDAAGSAVVTGETVSPDFPVVGGTYGPRGAGDAFVSKLTGAGTGLVYSEVFGGRGQDVGLQIAVDGVGYAYPAGWTDSADFPVHAAERPFGGAREGFVMKLAPDGTYAWGRFLGGPGVDEAHSVAVDSRDNVYVTGFTQSGGWLSGQHVAGGDQFHGAQCGSAPCSDAFYAELDGSGHMLMGSYIGGSKVDVGQTIGVDATGNIYLGGYTNSRDFPTVHPLAGGDSYRSATCTVGSTASPCDDGFLTKISADGSSILWSTYFGGSGEDSVQSLAVTPAGEVYFTGSTSSPDLPIKDPLPGGDIYHPGTCDLGQGTHPCSDAYVAKLGADGSLVYSTYFGTVGDESATTIAADGTGNAVIAGGTTSLALGTADAIQPSYGGGSSDAFSAKLYDPPTATPTATSTATPTPTATSTPTSTAVPPASRKKTCRKGAHRKAGKCVCNKGYHRVKGKCVKKNKK